MKHHDFAILGRMIGTPFLLLTTTGAKSGKARSLPLLYFMDGQDYVVIASAAGLTRHPGWYYNLKANPTASIFLSGKTIQVTAREAEGGNRERLWNRAVELYSGFATYKIRAGARQIPVMLLTPHTKAIT